MLLSPVNGHFYSASLFGCIKCSAEIIKSIQPDFACPNNFIPFLKACSIGNGACIYSKDKKSVFICQPQFRHQGTCNHLKFQTKALRAELIKCCCQCPWPLAPSGPSSCSPCMLPLWSLKSVCDLVTQQTVTPIFMEHFILYCDGLSGHDLGDRFPRIDGNMTLITVPPVGMKHFVLDTNGRSGRPHSCRHSQVSHVWLSCTMEPCPSQDNNQQNSKTDNRRLELRHAKLIFIVFFHYNSPCAANNLTFIVDFRSTISATNRLICVLIFSPIITEVLDGT